MMFYLEGLVPHWRRLGCRGLWMSLLGGLGIRNAVFRTVEKTEFFIDNLLVRSAPIDWCTASHDVLPQVYVQVQ